METSGLQECTLNDNVYAHASEICTAAQECFICNNGEWEEKIDVYPKPPTVDPEMQ